MSGRDSRDSASAITSVNFSAADGPLVVAPPTSTPTNATNVSVPDSGLTTAAKAGIGVVVSLTVLLLLGLLALLLRKRRRQQPQATNEQGGSKLRATQGGNVEMPNESHVSRPEELEVKRGKEMPTWDTAPVELPGDSPATGTSCRSTGGGHAFGFSCDGETMEKRTQDTLHDGSDGAAAALTPVTALRSAAGPFAPSTAEHRSSEDYQKKDRELELRHLDAEEERIRERRAQLLAAGVPKD